MVVVAGKRGGVSVQRARPYVEGASSLAKPCSGARLGHVGQRARFRARQQDSLDDLSVEGAILDCAVERPDDVVRIVALDESEDVRKLAPAITLALANADG